MATKERKPHPPTTYDYRYYPFITLFDSRELEKVIGSGACLSPGGWGGVVQLHAIAPAGWLGRPLYAGVRAVLQQGLHQQRHVLVRLCHPHHARASATGEVIGQTSCRVASHAPWACPGQAMRACSY